jgi:hypothetical protein
MYLVKCLFLHNHAMLSLSCIIFALAYILHCIVSLLAHICSYTLDHTESELEEPMEQAQVKEFTNLVCIKASPSAFNHAPYL